MDNKSSDKEQDPDNNSENEPRKKDDHFFDRWTDPEKNKMGNDITGDLKIANSNGELEGGQDKRWHMDDDDQD